MHASPRQQRLLLQLQELDTEELRLTRRIKNIAERAELSEAETALGPLRQTFMEAQHRLEDEQAELRRIEDDVHTVEQRYTRTSDRLGQSSNAKEAGQLQDELDALTRRRTALEDQQLVVMERLEGATETQQDIEAQLTQREQHVVELRATIEVHEASLGEELARVREERAGLAAEVQGPVLEVYEHTRARYGIGAARLNGRVSEGSNMTLDHSDYQAAMSTPADELYFCPSSGAILVREFDDESL